MIYDIHGGVCFFVCDTHNVFCIGKIGDKLQGENELKGAET